MDVKLSEGIQLFPDGEPRDTDTRAPVRWAEDYPAIPTLELMLFLTQHHSVEVLTPVASRKACLIDWTCLPTDLNHPSTALYIQRPHEGWHVYGMRGEPA